MKKPLNVSLRLLKRILMIQYITPIVILRYFEYIIGAAVYNTIERFDDGIRDCDKAIELNKNFVKVSLQQSIGLFYLLVIIFT